MAQFRNDRLLFEDTSGVPKQNSIVPCLICTKPFWMLPFIGVPDQICPECSKTHKDTARVICRQCAKKGKPVTICRLVPKVLENGYYIRPNAVLHSSACNVCQRGLTESSIIEIEDWERTLRPKKIIISPR